MTTAEMYRAPHADAPSTITPDLLATLRLTSTTVVAHFSLVIDTTTEHAARSDARHEQLMHELAALSMDPDSPLDRDSDIDIWGFDRS